MVFEDVKDLKHLPPMYAVGDDMLTGVYLIGKATICVFLDAHFYKECG